MKTYRHKATGTLIQVQDENAPVVEFSAQGGGLVRRMSHVTFHDQFMPWNGQWIYKLSQVTGDWLDVHLPCYLSEQRWNGWRMPMFTKEQGMTVCEHNPNVSWDESAGGFRVDQEWDADEPSYVVGPEQITVDGKVLTVYQIGDGWCWEAMS